MGSVLGRFAGQIDLHEEPDGPAFSASALLEPVRDGGAVDRVDDVEPSPRLFGLIGLEMPNEMPRDGQVGRGVHLGEGFLELVLAEVDLAAVGGGPYVVEAECLGNREETDRGGVASGPARRPRNTFADSGDPGSERNGIDH